MITSPSATSSKSVGVRPASRRGRVLRLACATLLLGLGAAIGASSCTETEASFYIAETITSTAALDSMTGLLTVTCGSTPSSVAQVWASTCNGQVTGGAVVACFGIRSELVASASDANIEARAIIMKSATVTLDNGGGEFANSAIVNPSVAGAAPVELVLPIYFGKSEDLANFLAAGSAQGSLVLHGRTTGNIDLDTPRFDFEAVFQGVPCMDN